MMKISNLINITEKKYLTTLEVFFMEKWGDTKLWSHDLSHHKRVWNYAKELLNYSDEVDNQFIEKLLIACYLHDIGMVIERGEKHGIQSRRLCEEFLSRNEMNTSDFTDLLHVIEYHDNKNYQDSSGQNILFTILTVADDLDALGYIGIYRYAEIYLLRGV